MAVDGNVVCRSGLGQARYYARLPAANDALVLVLLQASGLQDDGVIRDHVNLGALLGAGNLECTAPNYARKQITSGTTETPDDTNNRVDVDFPDPRWTALGSMTGTNSRQEIGALLVCYDPDVGAGSDADVLVLTKHYQPKILDGTDFVVEVNTAGFLRAAG